MKKLIIALAFICSASLAKADDKIWFEFGSVNVYVPFKTVNAVGLWDGIAKQTLAGAETPVFAWKRLEFVGGAVTTIDSPSAGTPFIGFHLAMPNPAENFVALSTFKPGVFAGRNFRTNEYVLGLKASLGLF